MPQETHRCGNLATALPFWSRYSAPFWDHYERPGTTMHVLGPRARLCRGNLATFALHMSQETHRYGNLATALSLAVIRPHFGHYEQRVPSSWRYQSLKLGGSSQVY